MTFPLYRRPGGVAFLDDDPDYLEMLAEVMPRHWRVQLYLRPVDFINRLQQEPPLWESEVWKHQSLIERGRNGRGLIPEVLRHWREDGTTRFGLTHVCVVDYSMPAMTGLQALSELTQWPGARVLLTGRADEQIAVKAFNQGLIEQYVPKQSPDITRLLMDSIQNLMDVPNSDYNQTWRSTLSREQHAVLLVPSVAKELQQISQQQHWVEHVVIGAPFGVLGLNAAGQASWLQLERHDNLGELAELAESQGVAPESVEEIRSGRKLIDLELQLDLQTTGAPRLNPARRLGQDGPLHAALFDVDIELCPGPVLSYAKFIAAHSRREVAD